MDNLSQDGTTEILESYAKAGHLRLIRQDERTYGRPSGSRGWRGLRRPSTAPTG